MRRALRGAAGVEVAVTGMGQEAAARAAAEWVPRVRAVVVCGVAGGTGGVARAGDVVIGDGLWIAPGVSGPPLAAVPLPGVVRGLVASVATPVDGAEARARLAAAGVVAVETEAGAWAAACSVARVPLAVVRGVLDTPEQPLGMAAGLVAPGEPGPTLRTLAHLGARPAAWPALWNLGRRAAEAERRAAEIAARVARSL